MTIGFIGVEIMPLIQQELNLRLKQVIGSKGHGMAVHKHLTRIQRAVAIKSLTELSNIHNYVLKHPDCSHKEIISFANTSKYQTERYSKIINHHPEQLKIKLDELEWLLKNPS